MIIHPVSYNVRFSCVGLWIFWVWAPQAFQIVEDILTMAIDSRFDFPNLPVGASKGGALLDVEFA